MAFSQSTITRVYRPVSDGAEMLVTWDSTAPAGTPYQIYINRLLVWHGTAKSAVIPWPSSKSRMDIGTVVSGEDTVDFSASLPAPPGGVGDRVTLTWDGGTFLGPDIDHFNIYMGTTAGGAVSYTTPVASVPAYIQNIISDGYGDGGYGDGGYGAAGGKYSWTSGHLKPGTWHFGVKSVDKAGNVGTLSIEITAAIVGPPNPPAVNSNNQRLTYTYNAGTRVPTLSWLASPA